LRSIEAHREYQVRRAEPRRDHYEETYSRGPDVEKHVAHPLLDLAGWRP